MTIPAQIAPTKISRGQFTTQVLDWSNIPQAPVIATLIYDFNAQGAGKQMRQIATAIIDNSRNSNTIILTNQLTQQTVIVYNGEIAQLPIFSPDYPRFTVACQNDVTPAVGVTQVTFTDFPMGFQIAQSGQSQGPSLNVQDVQLYNLLGNSQSTVAANATGRAGQLILPVLSQIVPTMQQVAVPLAGQQIFSAGVVKQFWYVQNLDSTAIVYLGFGNVSPTGTSGAPWVLPRAIITSAQFGEIIPSCGIKLASNAAGTLCNIGWA